MLLSTQYRARTLVLLAFVLAMMLCAVLAALPARVPGCAIVDVDRTREVLPCDGAPRPGMRVLPSHQVRVERDQRHDGLVVTARADSGIGNGAELCYEVQGTGPRSWVALTVMVPRSPDARGCTHPGDGVPILGNRCMLDEDARALSRRFGLQELQRALRYSHGPTLAMASGVDWLWVDLRR